MAKLSASSIGYDNITVSLTGLDSTYNGERLYDWYVKESTRMSWSDNDWVEQTDSDGVTRKKEYTFEGLEYGTSYDFKVTVTYYTADGHGEEVTVDFECYEISTKEDIYEEDEEDREYDPYFEQTDSSANYLKFTVYDAEEGSMVDFYLDGDHINEKEVGSSEQVTYTYRGLSPDTRYYVKIYVDGASIGGDYYRTDAAPLPEYYFTIDYKENYTIGAIVYSVSYGNKIAAKVRESETNKSVFNIEEMTSTGSPFLITFNGIVSPGVKYEMNVSVNGTWIGWQEFTIQQSRPIGGWAWWNTIESGLLVRLSVEEWTAFCNCINKFRSYQGLPPYVFTTVNKGNRISATICNQARTAISEINGHGELPAEMTDDSCISAAFFNGLKNALNSII